ncbi:MAG: ATP synthase F0 subunit A [Candidatus Jacksonbacteria bacterium RIFOXYC2_FULL_44_29]|nr:MAG: ATP synthase subunit a [Parcubacteria group bacterium GW2011_GWC2_44_22]OGY74467.1 MAG: ATP synthase F0 subunit A [Candidatus Jacksonbacteria bacterium RIFOXYA2_FULL_43_12]OGY77375.1 MAG: ATP synthase F0 subunit A [Candidatus Jacksonbacteria bacterium RIFOXYB2_FULL_44_15]OGY78147.1 MAG: ATP synthase F0 subunit A [Candidatus Jacksonbacteria bacterium RIFOXYD2_FULL_43_21]OGY80723.1 MAG: ATP synthase F0 subunit A [Candidatus Jacksonbacteria bacterium RIFOXYC2_FULL_44_29]HBH46796.1 ATP syn
MTLPPLSAEPIFYLGSFPVTNTMINSLIALGFFLVIGLLLRRSCREQPGKLQNFAEGALEFLFKYFDQVTGSREKTLRFLPIVGSLFFFILFSNWLGLLPGIGSIGIWEVKHGVREFIPLFRPAATDLNTTLAMAVLGVVVSHIVGIMTIGFFRYANKFIKLGSLWQAIRSFNPTKILVAVIELFVGLIEVISEAAKVLSLSLRLFGNIFAGEVLLTVMGTLMAFIVPLPFMMLELIVGVVQATVFSMLVLVYLTVATMEVHAEAH